jgi:hypothetical protein
VSTLSTFADSDFSGATGCCIRKTLKYELVASPLVVQVSGTKENAVSIAILPSKWLFRGAQSSQTWSDTNA